MVAAWLEAFGERSSKLVTKKNEREGVCDVAALIFYTREVAKTVSRFSSVNNFCVQESIEMLMKVRSMVCCLLGLSV